MLAIIHAEIVMPDHLIPDGVLFVEGDKIAGFGEMRTTPVPAGCDVLDAKGLYVGPGFVDIHVHAANHVEFFEDPIPVAQHHFKNGTTTIMPTLYFKLNQKRMVDAFHLIKDAMKKPEGKTMAGFYVEGPYMNPKFGSNRRDCPWANPIRREDYMPVLEAAGQDVFVWAVAPERENIEQFVQDAKKMNPKVNFAVGHSEATPQQIEALMPYGLRLGTHHTNATGTLAHYPECRGVCVDEAVNYNREIYAELISDSRGIHVHPYMQRLIRRIKGDDRLVLISDCSAGMGAPLPGCEDVDDVLFDPTGEVDGSNLSLNRACRNIMVHTGASVVEAFRFATYNPTRAIGLLDRGEIAVGKLADLVLVDHRFNVKKVIFRGEVQE